MKSFLYVVSEINKGNTILVIKVRIILSFFNIFYFCRVIFRVGFLVEIFVRSSSKPRRPDPKII